MLHDCATPDDFQALTGGTPAKFLHALQYRTGDVPTTDIGLHNAGKSIFHAVNQGDLEAIERRVTTMRILLAGDCTATSRGKLRWAEDIVKLVSEKLRE